MLAQFRKIKEVDHPMTRKPMTKASMNCGCNYNDPKVAKFLAK
jgi:hypothetical protein